MTPTSSTAATSEAATVSPALAEEAAVLLARLVGDPTAGFRDGQLESVAALVDRSWIEFGVLGLLTTAASALAVLDCAAATASRGWRSST